jgi:hypothetical protein
MGLFTDPAVLEVCSVQMVLLVEARLKGFNANILRLPLFVT